MDDIPLDDNNGEIQNPDQAIFIWNLLLCTYLQVIFTYFLHTDHIVKNTWSFKNSQFWFPIYLCTNSHEKWIYLQWWTPTSVYLQKERGLLFSFFFQNNCIFHFLIQFFMIFTFFCRSFAIFWNFFIILKSFAVF